MGWNHRYIYCLNLVVSVRLILKYFLSIWTECLLSQFIFSVTKFNVLQQLEAPILYISPSINLLQVDLYGCGFHLSPQAVLSHLYGLPFSEPKLFL